MDVESVGVNESAVLEWLEKDHGNDNFEAACAHDYIVYLSALVDALRLERDTLLELLDDALERLAYAESIVAAIHQLTKDASLSIVQTTTDPPAA